MYPLWYEEDTSRPSQQKTSQEAASAPAASLDYRLTASHHPDSLPPGQELLPDRRHCGPTRANRARLDQGFQPCYRKRRWDLFKPKPRPGRTPTFDERVQQGLLDIFEESPRRYGFSDSEWTLHWLAEVAVRTGLVSSISHESVRRLIDNSKRNCSALADLGAFGVTLSEAKGLVLRTNEIPRFAQNDRLSNYWRLTMARKTWV